MNSLLFSELCGLFCCFLCLLKIVVKLVFFLFEFIYFLIVDEVGIKYSLYLIERVEW